MGFLPAAAGHPGHLYFFYASKKGPAWAFDLKASAWSALSQEAVPVNLWSASMATDAKRRRFLFFGGKIADGPEVWVFEADSRRWRKLDLAAGSPAPPPRANPGWAHLPKSDRVLLYGGNGRYDHWLFDAEAGRWTELGSSRRRLAVSPGPTARPPPSSGATWCMTPSTTLWSWSATSTQPPRGWRCGSRPKRSPDRRRPVGKLDASHVPQGARRSAPRAGTRGVSQIRPTPGWRTRRRPRPPGRRPR